MIEYYKGEKIIKLDQPMLIELENDLNFIIVEEIEISSLKSGQLELRGNCYNYDDVKLSEPVRTMVAYDIKEIAVFEIDENGKIVE